MLHKIFNYKELHSLLKLKKIVSKILQDKILCIYYNFTMETPLPQIINTKNHTKIACSSRVPVQYSFRKTFQFYEGYFTYFYQIKSLENEYFCKFLEKNCNFCLSIEDF